MVVRPQLADRVRDTQLTASPQAELWLASSTCEESIQGEGHIMTLRELGGADDGHGTMWTS